MIIKVRCVFLKLVIIDNITFQAPKKGGKGKKGKKGKKSAKAKTPTVIDGISTEEMSKEQVCT